MVPLESTLHFNDMYDRFQGKALIHKRVVAILQRIDSSPNDFLRKFDTLQNCALNKTFSDNAPRDGGANRMIIHFAPPLRLLDFGKHDRAYRRWTIGKTSKSVQLARASEIATLPLGISRTIEAWETIGS
jgi:hypothetical protein